VAFDNGKRLSDIVDTGDPHAPKRHGVGLHPLPWFPPLRHIIEASTQRLIDQPF